MLKKQKKIGQKKLTRRKRMTQFGPMKTINSQYRRVPLSLTRFINQCNDYIDHLSLFHQYCLFRYTVSSATINLYLISHEMHHVTTWANVFFTYWYNTNTTNALVPDDFKLFIPFLLHPHTYNALSTPKQEMVAMQIIKKYIVTVQQLILNGPAVRGKGFDVFKMSIKYDALYDIKTLPTTVKQLPFNSTSTNMYYNFILFSTLKSTCCLFRIKIPAGAHVLWLSSRLSAYPFEREVITPYDCLFDIKHIKQRVLNYIHPMDMNIVKVQHHNVKMGNVYRFDEKKPCKQSACKIQSKWFTVYDCEYHNPD